MDKKTQLTLNEVQEIHRAGRLTDAKRGYQEILRVDPKNVTALHMLGVVFAEEGDLDEAQANLERAVLLDPNNAPLILHLANILKAKGLFHQAQQLLLDLTQSHPNFAAAFNNLGTVYYAQAKLEKAQVAYQQAIDLQPNYADAYYNLGLVLTKLNRMQEAINAYQALIELSPEHPGARFQLGCLFMQQFKYEQAASQFAKIENQHPFHFETQTNLATCYLRLGRLPEAKTHYLQAMDLMPNDIQVLFNLGVISMQQGQLEEAISFYLRTTRINPNHFDAQNNLAFAYLTLKKNEAALFHFREALRLQPNNEAIRHTINILVGEKNITNSPPEYVRALFDSYADHFEPHLKQVLHYQVPQQIHQAVMHVVNNTTVHWDILDLGCGTGLCGELFKSISRTLTGVDLSEKMLAVAAQKSIYTQLVHADILSFLSEKEAAYDLILGGDVLVYFGDLDAIFTAAYHALKPNGLFVFDTEINDKENFSLLSSGRFAHHKNYIDQLALAKHFAIIQSTVIPMRTQEQMLLHGYLYILKKD